MDDRLSRVESAVRDLVQSIGDVERRLWYSSVFGDVRAFVD
jgi:hypothetical protein